jgi:hypothetical protein
VLRLIRVVTEDEDRSARQRAGDDIADWLNGSGAVIVAVVLILVGAGFLVALFP